MTRILLVEDNESFAFGLVNNLEIEGYGTAKNTTFEVLGVPVVWLPWMIYPLKTERSTGFLLPELKTGSVRGAGKETQASQRRYSEAFQRPERDF